MLRSDISGQKKAKCLSHFAESCPVTIASDRHRREVTSSSSQLASWWPSPVSMLPSWFVL